ncbi:MAG: hypothetical protein KGL39_37625 [Patescibacteria group bacterium]|nr:hypothetical protein [Patescibacteria group bacterium]
MQAAADFLGPGAIEVDRYQAEIFDLVKRRFVFGQRIQVVLATGQPSRYFEQLGIPTASAVATRLIAPTATEPNRVERAVTLKAIAAQINYSQFDVEVTAQQAQFAYLEAKDLTDTIDAVLKEHDQELWNGNDTDLVNPSTNQYYGVSGQILNAPIVNAAAQQNVVPATGSLVDGTKSLIANMAARTDYEVRPNAFYMNPIFNDLFDREAKSVQLYYNEVEVIPGVIVKALPTAIGVIPLIPDPALKSLPSGSLTQHTGFVISEDDVEYHYLTSPLPRVFQLGLLANLASQFVCLKFGAVVAKGPNYAHAALITVR